MHSCLFLVFVMLQILKSECQCTYGDVRLVGGSGDYEGNVQVCVNGTWGYICDKSWSNYDSQVVCKQLGYSTTSATAKRRSYYGYGNGTIWLDIVSCTGEESALLQCLAGRYVANCGYDRVAGVICPYGGPLCSNGDVRIITIDSQYRSVGRVEVCFNDEWGTVCNTGWDSDDATVVCKQLGYEGYIYYYRDEDSHGSSLKSIWLTNLNCTSSQVSLLSCSYSTDTSDCTHNKDVSVACGSIDNSDCIDGDAKLWSAYDSTPDNEGIVLVCENGTWYPMYGNSDCRAAELACEAAGYSNLEKIRRYAGKYYGYYYDSHYHYYCPDNAESLSQCFASGYVYNYRDSLGVKCGLSNLNSCSNDGEIRLADGKSEAEGRVEYCFEGYWAPVCFLDIYTASLICKESGYQKWALIVADGRYGRTTNSRFDYIYCYSSHGSLSECPFYADSSVHTCSIQYGLKCFGPTNECTDGDIRLVDGDIEQEGRPEVCVDGIWGAICGYGWTVDDAYVTCVQLGYTEGLLNPIDYSISQFGIVSGPIVWSAVHCQHWNKNIHHCSKTVYPYYYYCSSIYVAGVRCTEGCSDGDIRLVGSSNTDEGTVEVCYNELWGLISDDGWTDNSAIVVCSQLGYTRGVAKVGSFYGKFMKTIHLKNVTCSGNEPILMDCKSTQLSVFNGKQLLPNTDVAGVKCIHNKDSGTDSISIVGSVLGVVMFLVTVSLAVLIVLLMLRKLKQHIERKDDPTDLIPVSNNPVYEEMKKLSEKNYCEVITHNN